jgi:hypothetical protein
MHTSSVGMNEWSLLASPMLLNDIIPTTIYFYFIYFLSVLGVELRALCLVGYFSTTRAMLLCVSLSLSLSLSLSVSLSLSLSLYIYIYVYTQVDI